MNTLQQQINLMSTKVDALYQLIEQLSSKLSDVAVECKFGATQLQHPEVVQPFNISPTKLMQDLVLVWNTKMFWQIATVLIR
jgi:hypothetical protein